MGEKAGETMVELVNMGIHSTHVDTAGSGVPGSARPTSFQ